LCQAVGVERGGYYAWRAAEPARAAKTAAEQAPTCRIQKTTITAPQHRPSSAPRQVLNSNGARDAFVSGFLSGHLAGPTSARAWSAGAFACTIHGTAQGFTSEVDLGLGRVTEWPTTISTDIATLSLGTSGTPGASISG
jgi:hypothetical protein